jgi:hypothetical protein
MSQGSMRDSVSNKKKRKAGKGFDFPRIVRIQQLRSEKLDPPGVICSPLYLCTSQLQKFTVSVEMIAIKLESK